MDIRPAKCNANMVIERYGYLMYEEELFAKRLEQLRLEKNVSAREMSLALGQNPSYICDYFQITPKDFFNDEKNNFYYTGELIREIQKLTGPQAQHLLAVIRDINHST